MHSWLVLKRLGLRKPCGFLFRSTRRLLERQLCGGAPSLLLFDLYKLGLISQYA
ncbi:MAG: hypothetical protein R6V75_05205 [Bacteroidales bacterium]